jgi:hypothetical protein
VKFRVSLATVCGIAGILLVSGCSSILIKPAVDNVKTVALVSAYMNRDFYDVRGPRDSVSLNNVVFAAKDLDVPDSDADEYEKLIAYGVKTYAEQLEGVGNWQWLPVTNVLSNSAYRKFADAIIGERPASGLLKTSAIIEEKGWYTARDMVRIPMERVTYSGKFVVIGNGKGSQADMRAALGQLCKDLDVDAVAVLEFDMAFRKLLFGLDFIGDLPAMPNISSSLVLVNRDGEVVVDSGRIIKGQGKRFEGDSVGMLRRDYVHFTDKSISARSL